MNYINNELVKYIEKNIFPNYSKNDKGHQIEHIKYVIKRSFELSKDLDINKNMIYTIAAYHDCGCYIDRDKHEKISAEIMCKDKNLQKFFTLEEITIIKEAIEDHRASLKNEPRSIYGKIVSSADRNIDINDFLKRVYGHALKHFPKYTIDEYIEYAYNHTKEKFGPDGYAKMYLKDKAYEDYLHEVAELISDKESFIVRFKKLNNIVK